VPNRTRVPTGASNFETRAVILSSPWRSATGSAIVSATATLGIGIADSTHKYNEYRVFRRRAAESRGEIGKYFRCLGRKFVTPWINGNFSLDQRMQVA